MWAISFEQLLEVHQQAMEVFGVKLDSITMRDINKKIIIPMCKGEESYALAKNPKGLKTGTFISHTWDEPFGEFVRSVKEAFKTKFHKPDLWICAFALVQGNTNNIENQLNMALDQSPFVRALKSADNFLIVRNSTTDLYSRIWCICEIMYARKYDFIPKKTQIAGPDCFTDEAISCLDAKSFSPEDKEKILRVLLEKDEDRAEIDKYIKKFRSYDSGGDGAGKKGSNGKQTTVEGFLGESWFSLMRDGLDDIGVEVIDHLKDLDEEDIDMLASKLKKVQKKRFVTKIRELIQD